MNPFERIFRALSDAGLRYVVVGGFAAVLHGHPRLTADIDLVLDLEPEPALEAVRALKALGLRPRAPVDLLEFADPARRRVWVAEKQLHVLSLYDPSNPMVEVDLFAESPIDFEELWRDSVEFDLDTYRVRAASLPHLIAMKRKVGRPQDMLDVEALEAILASKKAGHA